MDSQLKELNAPKIAENLREALALKGGWGSQRLSKAIWRDHGLKVHRNTIENYTRGKVTKPNPTVLRACAQILGVSESWLLYDVGEKTIEDEAARKAHEDRAISGVKLKIDKALARSFPLYDDLSDEAKAVLWGAWLAVRNDQAAGEESVDGLKVARRVARAIWLPLKTLEIDGATLRGRQLDNYVVSICTALQFLLKGV